MPRFRVAELMVVIAITALDIVISQPLLRSVLGGAGPSRDTPWQLIVGALPMANLLAVCLLIGLRRPEGRRFLWGFGVFGAAALAIYIALASSYPDFFLRPYILASLKFLPLLFPRPPWTTPRSLGLGLLAIAVVLGLPQLAFALLGGILFLLGSFFFRRFR
jgi:hypothetical protein